MAILVLHGMPGICEAMTDILCVESNGQVVVESHGAPCDTSPINKHCVDFQATDAHAGHQAASAPQWAVVDFAISLVPSLPLVWLPLAVLEPLPISSADPPRSQPISLLIHDTLVLLI